MKIIETHSSSDYKYEYVCKNSRFVALKKNKIIFTFKRKLKEIFLPQGFPESVSDDYTAYQVWDTIQALVSTITSTVANQAVLKGIGVGDDKATLLAATVTWIMKDGAGLIGRILFAYWKGTFLDCNCKRWRLFADILNDISIFLDIFTAYLPQQMFIFIICLSSIGRSIVGVAGGATRAALTMHQSRRNNMADVSAKDGSQESLSNLLGLILNLLVVSLVTDNPKLIWMMVVSLTALHLYANYQAVRSVCMSSFNQSRFHNVVHNWLECGSILQVKECNLMEPVWAGLKRYSIRNLTIGGSVTHLSYVMQMQFGDVYSIYQNEGYILLLDYKNKVNADVLILLKIGAGNLEQIKAIFQAEIIDFLLSDKQHNKSPIAINSHSKGDMESTNEAIANILNRSLTCCNNHFLDFITTVENEGWTFDPLLLGADEWRVDNVISE